MSAHVVVIDSLARRHNIKTTPGKHLSDVLEEACAKTGLNASQYGLKHNNKPVDLSRTIRLSGLSSGAKLELVQLSRSVGVVSVALQLPESVTPGAPSTRLTDKFPSSTTLWLLLRKFEAGVAGGSNGQRNLTARGAPAVSSGNTGSGRLYYQQPVIQVMGRELASFTDLQKTLAQLGFNTGSTLLRLSYRTSNTPLEEALTEMQQYFDSIDPVPTAAPTAAQLPTPTQQLGQVVDENFMPGSATTSQPDTLRDVADLEVLPATATTAETDEPLSQSISVDDAPIASVGQRPVSVYRPPTASTPSAALSSFNEADFTPTVEHAQLHQKMLQQSTMNKRLLTDAELEQQAQEELEKIAAIKEVEVKIRFPDQSSVSAKFTPSDTGAELYTFARGCLDETFRDQPFLLRNPGIKGKGESIPDDSKKLLIKHLLLKGRVLVVFGWTETASTQAKTARNVLKVSLRSLAQEIKAPEIPNDVSGKEDPGIKVNIGKMEESGSGEGSSSKKLPKWLKGLAKK